MTRKQQLIYLIGQYLIGKYDTPTFTDFMTRIFYIERDDSLSPEENDILAPLAHCADYFSPFESDHSMYRGFTREEDVRQAAKKAYNILSGIKEKWYCYKTEYGKATEAVTRLWSIIYNKSQDLKSPKIYYRQNQGVVTKIYGNTGKELDIKIGDNPFYRNMDIFTSGSEVIMDHTETPEDKYGFEVEHGNNIWYEINPKDVSKIINPYENGNVKLIIAREDADIPNWEYYVNCFEYDDCEYMLAFNARNESEAKEIIAESGFDFTEDTL